MIQGHGDDIYNFKRPIVSNFSSNVFYAADLSGLKEHLSQKLDLIGNYPEPKPYTLERELARHHQISPSNILVTNGATEAIYLVAQTFRGSNSRVVIPAFSEYKDACVMHGHRVRYSHLSLTRFKNVDLAWICTPNNPSGMVTQSKHELLKQFHAHPNILFVVDMSYKDFTLKEMLSPAEIVSLPNVILLHSMTKKYAIPGLRLGYLVTNESLVTKIQDNRMPWSVNQLAIEAGLYILQKGIPSTITMADYLQECERVHTMLRSTSEIYVWPSDSHILLATLPPKRKARLLKAYLADKYGFLIRDASNFTQRITSSFRICPQSPEENDKLFEYIQEWLDL